MAEKKTTPIVIDDVEYVYEDMSQKAQILVNHVIDLNRKIASAQFNLDQLQVGRQAFLNLLQQSLDTPPEEQPETAPSEQTVQ